MPRVSDAKEKLMKAALELIWESSYGATSVDDICAKADVKKGSFYHFFKSKSELQIVALESDWQQKRLHWNDIFSADKSPLKRFEDYFDYVYERQAELHRQRGQVLGCPLFCVGSEVCTQDEAIRVKVQEILARFVKYFESAIRDADAQHLIVAPDAAARARALFAYWQGTMTQARIENNLELLRQMKIGAMELLGVRQAEPLAV
jgi:TetR/AcrR family transcriptional regulator, transcriptional repressor for nem operon